MNYTNSILMFLILTKYQKSQLCIPQKKYFLNNISDNNNLILELSKIFQIEDSKNDDQKCELVSKIDFLTINIGFFNRIQFLL